MGIKKTLVFFILLLGCTSSAQITSYGLDYVNGGLLASKPENDKPLAVCAPNAQAKFPCRVIFVDEEMRVRSYIKDLENKIRACEDK